MTDPRRERPTTPATGNEVDVASGGATSTRIRTGTSAAAAGGQSSGGGPGVMSPDSMDEVRRLTAEAAAKRPRRPRTRYCETCGCSPCQCGRTVEKRPPRARPLLEVCVCGGPEIVALSPYDLDIMAGVQRHQIEPVHIAWDEARGTPLSQDQMRVRELDRLASELVGRPA